MLFETARKSKICAFFGVKWIKMWLFVCKSFFNICFLKIFFSPKSCFFEIGFSSKLCFLKILFSSKSCFLKIFFFFKTWRVVKLFFQNLLFKTSFQILAELSSKCYQNQKTTCWKTTRAWGKNVFFSSVWYVFVSRLVLYFWLLRFLWQLGSWWVCWLYHLHYQLIYTNLFGIQKMVNLQSFF